MSAAPHLVLAREVALVATVHVAACVVVLLLGFDHVSDDDYARVTIAQAFAHSPHLDPSGTSWLPFPFWALGTSMMLVGRSLAMARATSIALASLALTLPYLALRTTGSTRTRATVAIALAALSPWSLWLGAATVPESFTASLTTAAVIALGGTASQGEPTTSPPWTRIGFALGMLAACLSRYEAWPVAAVLALVLAARARADRRVLALAMIVAAGPLLWLAWNAHAHGDALHFFARVTRFKRALGESSTDPMAALLLYPRLLVTSRPDLLVAVLVALTCARAASVTAELRARWLVPLACVLAQLAFLAYGNVRDGAPAHHAERALLGVFFLVAVFAGDVLVATRSAARANVLRQGSPALVLLAWVATAALSFRDVPGNKPAEDRSSQLAMGNELRGSNVPHVIVTPCAFEQFALIAAFEAPERVETRPRTDTPVVASCPFVERR